MKNKSILALFKGNNGDLVIDQTRVSDKSINDYLENFHNSDDASKSVVEYTFEELRKLIAIYNSDFRKIDNVSGRLNFNDCLPVLIQLVQQRIIEKVVCYNRNGLMLYQFDRDVFESIYNPPLIKKIEHFYAKRVPKECSYYDLCWNKDRTQIWMYGNKEKCWTTVWQDPKKREPMKNGARYFFQLIDNIGKPCLNKKEWKYIKKQLNSAIELKQSVFNSYKLPVGYGFKEHNIGG